ncbi:MAG: class I SAM-dependent methyltransferase [Planctomycetota bacterium]
MKDSSKRPWYDLAFGEHYLDLYAHRDEAAAEAEVRFAAEALKLEKGHRVVDLGCGPGFHLEALYRLAIEALGVDLSAPLLGRVAAPCGSVRADLRFLPLRGSFDAALTFFTTLGYFGQEGENRKVLREVARILRPGGGFLVDQLNAAQVRAALVPRSEREVKGCRVLERRWIEEAPARVLKRVEVFQGGETVHAYTESVRLYGEGELREALGDVGLAVEFVFGDFDGRPLDEDTPRMILVGRKSE